MSKLERTTAELYQELEEDRRKDADFDRELHDLFIDGHVTIQEAMQLLWVHLTGDEKIGTVFDIDIDDVSEAN